MSVYGNRPSESNPPKKFGCLTVLLWIFFLPIMILIAIAKSPKLSKPAKTVWTGVIIILLFFFLIAAFSDTTPSNNTPVPESSSTSQTNQNQSADSSDATDSKPLTITSISVANAEDSKTFKTIVGGSKQLTYLITPYQIKQEDIRIVVTNKDVVKASIVSMTSASGEKQTVTINMETLSEGKSEVYISSLDGKVIGPKTSVAVIAEAKPEEPEGSTGSTGSTGSKKSDGSSDNSRTVYITPTGKRYHFDPDCGGKNSRPTTLNKIGKSLSPCKKCAY